jgi:hypothetical protein
MLRITLCGGKYEINRSDDFSTFVSLRNGEPWRNLIGDNLISALCDEVCELRKTLENKESTGTQQTTNKPSAKCSCCEDDEDINTYRDSDYKYCPYCGVALRQ